MEKRRMSDVMFTEEDLLIAKDGIRKNLIKFFLVNKITMRDFKTRHTKWCDAIGTPQRQIASSWNNLVKLIYAPDATLTYAKFTQITKGILQSNVIKLAMTYKDLDGTETTIAVDLTSF